MTKSEGIMIFKDTMEYLIDGLLTPEQFAELMQLIYHTKWGEGVDEKTITDKQVLLVWKTLKHTIIKSVKNAKQYAKKQQEIQPNTEFDNEPKISENKGIITVEYPNPQPMEESVSDGQEMGKNEVPEIHEEDGDFRYGEIDTSDPMMSFLREDEESNEGKAIEPPSYYVKRNKSGETWEEYIKRISNKDVAV